VLGSDGKNVVMVVVACFSDWANLVGVTRDGYGWVSERILSHRWRVVFQRGVV